MLFPRISRVVARPPLSEAGVMASTKAGEPYLYGPGPASRRRYTGLVVVEDPETPSVLESDTSRWKPDDNMVSPVTPKDYYCPADSPAAKLKQIRLRSLLVFLSTRPLRLRFRHLFSLLLVAASLGVLSRLYGIGFGPTAPAKQTRHGAALETRPARVEEKDGSLGGLRVVSFGRGDIASPIVGAGSAGAPSEGWTGVMCKMVRSALILRTASTALLHVLLYQPSITPPAPNMQNTFLA